LVKKLDFISSCAIVPASLGLVLWLFLTILALPVEPRGLQLVHRLHLAGILCFSGGLILAVAAVVRRKLQPASAQAGWNPISLLVGAVSLLGLVCTFGLTGGKGVTAPSLNTCVNNLRVLEKATEEIALERNLEAGATVAEAEIVRRLGGRLPKCPGGGNYSYGIVGRPPSCSLPEHAFK
jgi:hypothetical protein